jgi:hypothetical protein
MKKIILSAVLAAMVMINYAQVTTTDAPQLSRKDLLLKSKKQETAGWICLGAGASLMVVGIATFPKDYNIWGNDKSTESKATVSTLFIGFGFMSMLSSIPLFILTTKNKREATLMVTSQKTATGLFTAIPKTVTGLTLSISL